MAVSQQHGGYLYSLDLVMSISCSDPICLQRIYQISFLADIWHENANDGRITPFTNILTSYINSHINNVRIMTGHTNNATADTSEGQFRLSLIFMSMA